MTPDKGKKKKRKVSAPRRIRYPAFRDGASYSRNAEALVEDFGECRRSSICREFATDLADGLCQKHWDMSEPT